MHIERKPHPLPVGTRSSDVTICVMSCHVMSWCHMLEQIHALWPPLPPRVAVPLLLTLHSASSYASAVSNKTMRHPAPLQMHRMIMVHSSRRMYTADAPSTPHVLRMQPRPGGKTFCWAGPNLLMWREDHHTSAHWIPPALPPCKRVPFPPVRASDDMTPSPSPDNTFQSMSTHRRSTFAIHNGGGGGA